MKALVPRISSPVRHLLGSLTEHSSSPWYLWTKVKRGERNHRPAWTHRDEGGRGGTWEVPDYDFHRAVVLGVVDVSGLPARSGLRIHPLDFQALDFGTRVRVRATPLGRAALVVYDHRNATARERAAAKLAADRAKRSPIPGAGLIPGPNFSVPRSPANAVARKVGP